jgi:hypothetical protein
MVKAIASLNACPNHDPKELEKWVTNQCSYYRLNDRSGEADWLRYAYPAPPEAVAKSESPTRETTNKGVFGVCGNPLVLSIRTDSLSVNIPTTLLKPLVPSDIFNLTWDVAFKQAGIRRTQPVESGLLSDNLQKPIVIPDVLPDSIPNDPAVQRTSGVDASASRIVSLITSYFPENKPAKETAKEPESADRTSKLTPAQLPDIPKLAIPVREKRGLLSPPQTNPEVPPTPFPPDLVLPNLSEIDKEPVVPPPSPK